MLDIRRGPVVAVIGGQYGSEGKGVICHHLANHFFMHVRVGGPQAGHTFYHEGQKFVMRQLPCGWTNPAAQLVIGAGAVVDLDLLKHEIAVASEAMHEPNLRERVLLDAQATVVGHEEREFERGTDMGGHIGSTMEGVGAARRLRIARQEFVPTLVRQYSMLMQEICPVGDTAGFIRKEIKGGRPTLLEGTQGAGLSLLHGPWPFVTSQDISPAQLLADVGIPPRWLSATLMVVRTYPIRVGGNSGLLLNETDWAFVSKIAGRPVEEFTTVTGRLRRVAMFDPNMVAREIERCGATALALTFLDYLYPCDAGVREWTGLSVGAQKHIFGMEAAFDMPILFAGTGGPDCAVVETVRNASWQLRKREAVVAAAAL